MLVLRMQVSNFTLRRTSSPNLIRRFGFGKPTPVQYCITTELMYIKTLDPYIRLLDRWLSDAYWRTGRSEFDINAWTSVSREYRSDYIS